LVSPFGHCGDAVAKATLYSAFGSKEELVRAYLEARHAARRATVLAEMALHDDPGQKLPALFDVLVTTVKQPEFRGCAFANAAAESGPDSAKLQAGSEKWGLLGVRVTRVDLLHKVHLSEFHVLEENWLNKQSHLYFIAEIIFLLLKQFLL